MATVSGFCCATDVGKSVSDCVPVGGRFAGHPRLDYGNSRRSRGSVDFSRQWMRLQDWYVGHFGMTMSFRHSKTFTAGFGLWSESISRSPYQFTDVRSPHRSIYPATFSVSPTPIIAVSGRLATVGDRAFSVAGSRLWKTGISCPANASTSAPTLAVFRKHLETYLFCRSYYSESLTERYWLLLSDFTPCLDVRVFFTLRPLKLYTFVGRSP